MIKSMTGHGRAERILAPWKAKVAVEIRTVNHKFLEVALRLPTSLAGFENEIREVIRGHLRRGYVQFNIAVDEVEAGPALDLDRHLVRDYLKLAHELREKFHLTGDVDVNQVLQFPGIVKANKLEQIRPKFWAAVLKVIGR